MYRSVYRSTASNRKRVSTLSLHCCYHADISVGRIWIASHMGICSHSANEAYLVKFLNDDDDDDQIIITENENDFFVIISFKVSREPTK